MSDGYDSPPPGPDERQWAMFAHLASLANLMVPFGAIIGPLIVWLTKKDTSPFVDHHGKESVQFQASFLAYHMVFVFGGLVSFVVSMFAASAGNSRGMNEMIASVALIAVFGIGGLALLLRMFVLVTMVVAAVKAHGGEPFRYPLTIRLLK